MKLKQRGMRFLHVLHILSASIWFGGTVCIGALAYNCFFHLSEPEFSVVAPWVNELYGSVILPFAIFTMVQGLAYALITNWGFLKHKWVLVKWIFTLLVTLCVGLGSIDQMITALDKVQTSGLTGGLSDGGGVLFFIFLQILIMAVMLIISVYKPRKRRPKTLSCQSTTVL